MDAQEGGSYTAFTPMPLAGGRHRKSHKKSHKHGHKLRVVTKKVAHHHLKKLGLRMRGGDQHEGMVTGSTPPPAGGKRHRKKSHKKHHGLFGGMNMY